MAGGRSVPGATSFSHVARTNIISDSLEADFRKLFSEPGRATPLKDRNLPKSFFDEPDEVSSPKTHQYDFSTRTRGSRCQPSDTTHFIAIKTPSRKDRARYTPSPGPTPSNAGKKKKGRKPKTIRLYDTHSGRASAPPLCSADDEPETRARSMSDLGNHVYDQDGLCTPLLFGTHQDEVASGVSHRQVPISPTSSLATNSFTGLDDMLGSESPRVDSHVLDSVDYAFGPNADDVGAWMESTLRARPMELEAQTENTATIKNINGFIMYETDLPTGMVHDPLEHDVTVDETDALGVNGALL
eukprot:m.7779 g.7779  ORF g.7779 m.7779 type:complete len:300 (+) comp2478_c0_seq1:269-1168(+)